MTTTTIEIPSGVFDVFDRLARIAGIDGGGTAEIVATLQDLVDQTLNSPNDPCGIAENLLHCWGHVSPDEREGVEGELVAEVKRLRLATIAQRGTAAGSQH